MRRNLLTFKDIIERTGISRAALQSYKARGLLPSPIAFTAEADGTARQVGQFDPSVLETIARIQALAASGVSLDEIGMRLAANDPGQPARLSSVHLANNNSRAVLQLTLEMTKSVKVADSTFAAVRAALPSEQAVVELVGTIATYNMVSRFLVALGVDEES